QGVAGAEAAGVEILQVDLAGESGLPQGAFRTGETVLLRLRFRTKSALDRPLIAFSLYREDGLYVAQASTEQAGYHTGTCRGEVRVEFRWECPLASGAYRVSAAVWESGGRTQLAQAHSAAGFEVLKRPGHDAGVLRWEGAWNLQANPEVAGREDDVRG
ncbi:MAG: Wzt carbohydrate-binding domain-containing protein, partial [Planctomycetaceae bacterium]